MKKCPSSTRCWDLNSQQTAMSPSPSTTRPGFPPCENDLISERHSNSFEITFHISQLGKMYFAAIRQVKEPDNVLVATYRFRTMASKINYLF